MMRVLLVAEGPSEPNGALQSLVCRLRGQNIDFRCELMKDRKVKVHVARGKGGGFTKRALAWLRFAVQEKADALVLLIDEDNKIERHQEIDAAQESGVFALPRAMGVAIRTFDAWMLADEAALARVLGGPINRQKDPESIRDPKAVFNDLAKDVDVDASQLYARVAETVDLAGLRSRCPNGFGPFAERVEAL
jgi:hypothetical protein